MCKKKKVKNKIQKNTIDIGVRKNFLGKLRKVPPTKEKDWNFLLYYTMLMEDTKVKVKTIQSFGEDICNHKSTKDGNIFIKKHTQKAFFSS